LERLRAIAIPFPIVRMQIERLVVDAGADVALPQLCDHLVARQPELLEVEDEGVEVQRVAVAG